MQWERVRHSACLLMNEWKLWQLNISRHSVVVTKEGGQVVEFQNRACLRAEQLKLMNIYIQIRQSWKVKLAFFFNVKTLQKFSRTCPHSSASQRLRIKRCGEKVTSPLMGSQWCHITTQILWSPSKPAPLRADWLTGCERGRGIFFSFLLLD